MTKETNKKIKNVFIGRLSFSIKVSLQTISCYKKNFIIKMYLETFIVYFFFLFTGKLCDCYVDIGKFFKFAQLKQTLTIGSKGNSHTAQTV